MQKEAEERVREMQARSRLFSDSGAKTKPDFVPDRPSDRREPDFVPSRFPSTGGTFFQNPNFGFANPLNSIGNERLIILGLLWLLWNEHADSKLLLALVYLLL